MQIMLSKSIIPLDLPIRLPGTSKSDARCAFHKQSCLSHFQNLNLALLIFQSYSDLRLLLTLWVTSCSHEAGAGLLPDHSFITLLSFLLCIINRLNYFSSHPLLSYLCIFFIEFGPDWSIFPFFWKVSCLEFLA